MAELKPHISFITLNVNEFNSPIKEKICRLDHKLNSNARMFIRDTHKVIL